MTGTRHQWTRRLHQLQVEQLSPTVLRQARPGWTALYYPLLHLVHPRYSCSSTLEPELICRNANLEKVLSTVVSNGLKAGWLALGHGPDDPGGSKSLPLIDPPKDAAASNPPISSANHQELLQQSPVLSTRASRGIELGREPRGIDEL